MPRDLTGYLQDAAGYASELLDEVIDTPSRFEDADTDEVHDAAVALVNAVEKLRRDMAEHPADEAAAYRYDSNRHAGL